MAVVIAAITMFIVPAASAAQQLENAEALHERCASSSWSYYVVCQQFLLGIGREAAFCVPDGTSAARLQLDFARYFGDHPALAGASADAAARAYLEAAYAC